MIRTKLSSTTKTLDKYIREIALYSGINDITVEIGEEQKSFSPNTVFINEKRCKTLENVLTAFAEQVYDRNVHTHSRPSTVVWLQKGLSKAKARKAAAVIEKAIEPDILFGLDNAYH